MTGERWELLKESLHNRFKVLEQSTEDLAMDTAEGAAKVGEQEILVVQTPAGQIKVVCEIRPQVLEKKFHYTHRQGQSAQTEYKFSDTEKTYKMRLFKWSDAEDDWKELDADKMEGIM